MPSDTNVPHEHLTEPVSAEQWSRLSLRDRLVTRISFVQAEVNIISQELASEGLIPGVWMAKRIDCIALAAESIRHEIAAGRTPGLWMEEMLDDIYTASDSLLLRLNAMKSPRKERFYQWLESVRRSRFVEWIVRTSRSLSAKLLRRREE